MSTCALLAACSSSGNAAAPTTTVATALTTAATTAATVAKLTAAQVVTALKAQGNPVVHVVVYTEDTDPNHKLGRPGGYTSKAAFTDTRISTGQATDTSEGSVDLGGGVEVFADPADATARGKFIQTAFKTAQFGGEYDYVAGGILLRLSTVLTPTQAKAYAAALGDLAGTQATPVTP